MERFYELTGILFGVLRIVGLGMSGIGFLVAVYHYHLSRDGQDKILKWLVLFVAILIAPAIVTIIFRQVFGM